MVVDERALYCAVAMGFVEPASKKQEHTLRMLCPCQVQQSLLFWAKPCLIELFEGRPHREEFTHQIKKVFHFVWKSNQKF